MHFTIDILFDIFPQLCDAEQNPLISCYISQIHIVLGHVGRANISLVATFPLPYLGNSDPCVGAVTYELPHPFASSIVSFENHKR